ncbi:probable methionine--tRNA ligase, partial [Tanacetum coccineum]
VKDTLFIWADLQIKINNELISTLGNFINRVLCFIARDPVLDAPGADAHPLYKKIEKEIGSKVDKYVKAMDKVIMILKHISAVTIKVYDSVLNEFSLE